MVSSRIGPGSSGITSTPRPERTAPARGAEETQSTLQPEALRESFVSTQVASRQPPRLALDGFAQSMASQAATRLFSKDLEALSLRDADSVAGDLASIFLEHVSDAQAEGRADAMETLAELIRGYEHLRILSTGELG